MSATTDVVSRLYHELGRMILSFADMERAIHQTLLHYTRMDDDTGRSVLSGLSVSPAIEALRSLVANGAIKGKRAAELLTATQHAAVLLSARDFVVHYGTDLSMVIEADGSMRFSNHGRKNKREKDQLRYFSPETLNGIALDAQWISFVLRAHRGGWSARFSPLLDPAKPPPWRYRHDPPKTKHPAPLDAQAPRRRQPQASPPKSPRKEKT